MGKRYPEILSEIKINKLLNWRQRYSKQEYPYKVAYNLLYEMLVVEKMWGEIQIPYLSPLFDSGYQKFQNFEDALKAVIDRSNFIAKRDIHHLVDSEYKKRKFIAGFNWESTRERVTKAQNGDNNEVQEIELAYYFYTCGIEQIYAWSALGYLGYNQQSAFFDISGFAFGGVDYNSFQSLVHYFGSVAGNFYKPLPNLF